MESQTCTITVINKGFSSTYVETVKFNPENIINKINQTRKTGEILRQNCMDIKKWSGVQMFSRELTDKMVI